MTAVVALSGAWIVETTGPCRREVSAVLAETYGVQLVG
jgi:hypothetical protein